MTSQVRQTARPYESRLDQIKRRLNWIYGMPLVRTSRDRGCDLTVCRGQRPSDVVVGIYCDRETGIFTLTAWTMAAWSSYDGVPFQATQRDAFLRATAWVLQFIPDTPVN